jgi:hypothetical protein
LNDSTIGKKQKKALEKALEVNKRIFKSLPVPAPLPWVRRWNDAAQRAEYVHPDGAAFPEPQAALAGLIRVDPESELLHGATVALRRFYSRGYPPSAAAYDDHEAVHGVERPNHSLANALRKAALAPAVIAALEANDAGTAPTFDAEELVALQLALVFAVCGRESEASSSDDPEAYARFRRVSCDALVAHVRQRGFAEPVVLAASSALESMRDSGAAVGAGPTAAAMQRVMCMCHDLDLFRCLDEETMTEKLASTVEPFVGGPPAANRLARRAVAAIRASGDRLVSDAPAGDLTGCTRCDPEVEYDAEAFPRCSLDARECWRAIPASAADAESREGGGVGGGRAAGLGCTFATSAFRREYLAAAPPSKYMELLTVVQNVLQVHACVHGHDESDADDMHTRLMKEMLEHRHELLDETMSVAQRLWTSALKHSVDKRELCHIINAAIRADGPDDLITEVAKLSRGINMLLVSIRRGVKPARFPTDGLCYRGGVLPDEHRFFYERVGSQFRVPGFLATSLVIKKAVWFAKRASTECDGRHHKIVWEVRVDPAGKDDESMLCRNANYVEKTNCPGE